jgi:hypothetical protein
MTRPGLKIFILLIAIFSFTFNALAMTVYMNDGSEIEAQSAWREGEKIYVRVSPDLCLDFPASEVNSGKSGIRNASLKKRPQTLKESGSSASARSGDVIDELIDLSGQRRDFKDIFGRGEHGVVEQLFADSCTPELAEKTLRRCLKQRLNNRELAWLLAWYKSPLGAKVVEADSVLDFNRQENTLTYVGIDTAPGFKERMSLIRQLEKNTGVSEITTRLAQRLMQRLISVIPPNHPEGYEIKARLRENTHTLEENRKKLIQRWAYSYRDLTLNELNDYLKFLSSGAGSKYMAAIRDATEDIFGKVTNNMEKELRNYMGV